MSDGAPDLHSGGCPVCREQTRFIRVWGTAFGGVPNYETCQICGWAWYGAFGVGRFAPLSHEEEWRLRVNEARDALKRRKDYLKEKSNDKES